MQLNRNLCTGYYILTTYNNEKKHLKLFEADVPVKNDYILKLPFYRPFRTFMMDPSWRPPAPCRVGDKLIDIDTPALLLDLDVAERNRQQLMRMMTTYPGVRVRPHIKAHKCPELARLQMQDGAVGVCAQTLSEAEAMVYGGGSNDVLISNQVIGTAKLKRLVTLVKYARMSVCVDDITNIRDINMAAGEGGVTIDCVVEVNVGQDRCGVEPGEPAVPLAKEIVSLPHVNFKGVQCYQGWNQHIRKTGERREAVQKVVDMASVTLQALKAAGVECDYVTGGGTGTFPYEAASGVFTEVQPGSYLLMDADYGRNLGEDGQLCHEFEHSLHVLATVQSAQGEARAVLDAGMKAVSLDSGVPLLSEHRGLIYHGGGDEHGIIKPAGSLKVGELVWLIPGHCDPTVNLHDWLVGVRQGVVETVWRILGRGPGV